MRELVKRRTLMLKILLKRTTPQTNLISKLLMNPMKRLWKRLTLKLNKPLKNQTLPLKNNSLILLEMMKKVKPNLKNSLLPMKLLNKNSKNQMLRLKLN